MVAMENFSLATIFIRGLNDFNLVPYFKYPLNYMKLTCKKMILRFGCFCSKATVTFSFFPYNFFFFFFFFFFSFFVFFPLLRLFLLLLLCLLLYRCILASLYEGLSVRPTVRVSVCPWVCMSVSIKEKSRKLPEIIRK